MWVIATSLVSAKPKPGVTCRILFLDGPDSAPQTLQLFDGTSAQAVDLPRLNFSEVYKLPGGPLRLHLLQEPPLDPENLPAGAPSATVGEGAQHIYLLLMSDPENKVAPVRMEVINANEDRLKAGQMLWFNLSDKRVGGTVGSEKLVIGPGKRALLDAPARGGKDYPVDIGYQLPGNPQVYPLCETKWRHDPASRSAAFIIPPKRGRTPRILVFPDYREVEKEE